MDDYSKKVLEFAKIEPTELDDLHFLVSTCKSLYEHPDLDAEVKEALVTKACKMIGLVFKESKEI